MKCRRFVKPLFRARFREARLLECAEAIKSAGLTPEGLHGLRTIIGRLVRHEISAGDVASVVERFPTPNERILALADLSGAGLVREAVRHA